jgi:hypothetical protein
VETTRNYQYDEEIDCFEVKGLKIIIPEEQRFDRWKVAYYDSFHLADQWTPFMIKWDQWNSFMIKMGPVSFGAALIAAPNPEMDHWTSRFLSWSIGRQLLRVGT